MNSSFRKKLLLFHTWSGLTIGLVMVFLAVTGAGFVLRPALDDIVNRDLLVVPACQARLPLDTLAAKAREAHPQAKLHSIEMTVEDTASTAIVFTDKDLVYINPCTGEVLGTQNEYGGFFGLLDGLHRFRFMENGRLVAGWNNVIFVVILLAGGVVLWWPRPKQSFKNALKFNPRLPGVARTTNLHKVVGIYTSVVLLMIAATGVPLSFQPVKDFIGRVVGSSTESPKPPTSSVPGEAKPLSMEALWQRSKALFPEQEWISLRYPTKPSDSVGMEILERGRPHAEAKSYLYLDTYTGDTLRLSHYTTDTALGRKVYLYCLVLHSGLIGGLPYQMLLLLVALGMPVMAYSGFSPYLRRKFRTPVKATVSLQLVKKTVEAIDICTFEFADPKGKMLPPFSAGSHIDVHARPGLVRQYSLCNDPGDTHRYLIGVLRHPQSRGGSSAMHELNEGEVIEVSAPKNHFPLVHSAKRSLLLAGGIGVTPILCMAERLANTGADFEMHYCTRSPERTAFVNRIKKSSYAARVTFHSDEGPTEQRFNMQAVLANPDPDTHLYVCGPMGFMDTVLETAAKSGWPDNHLHREYFSGAVRTSQDDVAFDVKLASTGRMIHVARDKTVLAALTECGVDVQSSCSEGVCGTCLTRVLEGDPDHRDVFLTAEDRAKKDVFLPCCSRSSGGMLILDL